MPFEERSFEGGGKREKRKDIRVKGKSGDKIKVWGEKGKKGDPVSEFEKRGGCGRRNKI